MHNYRPALIAEVRTVKSFSPRPKLPKYGGKQSKVSHYIKRLGNIDELYDDEPVSFRGKSITGSNTTSSSSPLRTRLSYALSSGTPPNLVPRNQINLGQPNQRASFEYGRRPRKQGPPCANWPTNGGMGLIYRWAFCLPPPPRSYLH